MDEKDVYTVIQHLHRTEAWNNYKANSAGLVSLWSQEENNNKKQRETFTPIRRSEAQYFAEAQQRMAEDLHSGSDCATDPTLQPVSVLHEQQGTLCWPQDSGWQG